MSSRKASATALFEAVVLFDYEAVESTEISVPKGAIVSVRDVNESGWCLVKYDGKAGWIPTDYVEKLHGVQSVPTQDEPLPEVPQTNDDNSPINNDEITDAVNKLAIESKKDIEICSSCNQPVTDRFVVAKGKHLHVECFSCSMCKKSLAGQPFIEKEGDFYCEDDFYRKFNPPCGGCNDVIKGKYLNALGKSWHPNCFVCSACNQPFTEGKFRKHEDLPYCDTDFNKLFGTSCSKCGNNIDGKIFEALGKKFHESCFTCEKDGHAIGVDSHFHVFEDKVYCPEHFEALFLQQCAGCGKAITEEYIKVADSHFHPECWKCATCNNVLDRNQVSQFEGKFVCSSCHNKTIAQHVKENKIVAPTKVDESKNEIVHRATTTDGPKSVAPAAPTPNDPNGPTMYYSLSVLQKIDSLPAGVDKTKRETYLSPEVFQRIFKMTPEEFEKLKAWRKKKLKQQSNRDGWLQVWNFSVQREYIQTGTSFVKAGLKLIMEYFEVY